MLLLLTSSFSLCSSKVRNPVAAAMAACSFVRAAVNETEPLVDPQKREDTREDVSVIYNSLQFINDLVSEGISDCLRWCVLPCF